MEVIVPDDQLSLAIGKKGQNVRLASRLTGWKLDVRSEAEAEEEARERAASLIGDPGHRRRDRRAALPARLQVGRGARRRRRRARHRGRGRRPDKATGIVKSAQAHVEQKRVEAEARGRGGRRGGGGGRAARRPRRSPRSARRRRRSRRRQRPASATTTCERVRREPDSHLRRMPHPRRAVGARARRGARRRARDRSRRRGSAVAARYLHVEPMRAWTTFARRGGFVRSLRCVVAEPRARSCLRARFAGGAWLSR